MHDYTLAQQQAINSIEKNTVVLAGAGSGKTSVLVDRFIKIVDSGVDCRNVLAITFTNKAANEMVERIREKMTVLSGNSSGMKREFWHNQKKLISMSYIGTIHGLCANIIRTNPLEANVEPDFYITDETEAVMLLEEAIKQTLQQEIKNKHESALLLCKDYGYLRLVECLQGLVLQFNSDEVSASDFVEQLAKGSKSLLEFMPTLKEEFLYKVEELVSGIGDLKAGKHQTDLQTIAENIPQIKEALADLPMQFDQVTVLDSLFDGLAARSKDKALVVEVKELKLQIVDYCYENKAIDMIGHWAKVIQKCVVNFAKNKRAKGVLTFDDLEYTTYKLLVKNPKICHKYNRNFTHIMLDEFQDTNELQKKITYLLAGGDEKALNGDKLFVVGDDKQSIYRFRGADVSVFGQVRSAVQQLQGEEIHLLDNFRSSCGILDVCNDLFASLMDTMQAKGVIFEPLLANKDNCTEPVEMMLVEKGDNKHAVEAKSLAIRLKKLAQEENYCYKDMAVLLRVKTHLDEYINAFEEMEIPYNVLDGQGFFSVSEIVDMLNLLRFLESEHKNLALIGVLRSPLFALDDQTITVFALLAEKDSFWQKMDMQLPEYISLEQRELADRAKNILQELLRLAKVVSLGPLIRIIIEQLQVMPLMLIYPDGKQKYANTEKLVDIIFAFEQETGGGLTEFINHIDNLLAMEARESMEQIEDENSDAVKILTIHKSKGLQFKVVVLPDFGASFYSDKDSVFYEKKRGLGIKVRDVNGGLRPTALFKKLKDEDNAYNLQEMKRLLYVAMTRAEEKLILSGTLEQSEKESWLNWFKSSFTEEEDFFVGQTGKIKKVVLDDLYLAENNLFADEKVQQDFDFALLEKQVANLSKLEEHKNIRFSATALRDYQHCPRLFYYKYLVEMPEFTESLATSEQGDGVQANIVGLIVHSVLEEIGEKDFADVLLEAIKKHTDVENSQYVFDRIAVWLQKYLEGQLFTELDRENYLSEQDFLLPLITVDGEQIWFAGSIDCLLVEGDNLTIVDFKSDRDLNEKASTYEHQLMLYALAAEQLYPDKKVVEAKLHFVRLNESVSIDIVNERTRLLSEIETLCKKIIAQQSEVEFVAQTDWCQFCGFNYFCPVSGKDN